MYQGCTVTKTSHLPIRYFLALLWAHPILHISTIRVKVFTWLILVYINELSASSPSFLILCGNHLPTLWIGGWIGHTLLWTIWKENNVLILVEIHVRIFDTSTHSVVANRNTLSQFYINKKFRICLFFLCAPNHDIRLIPPSNVGYKHVDKHDILIKIWYTLIFKTARKSHIYLKHTP